MTHPEDREFQDLREQLQELRHETPPHQIYTSIRRNVLLEIENRQTAFWHRAWPILATAVACAALLVVATRPKTDQLITLRLPQIALPEVPAFEQPQPPATRRMRTVKTRPIHASEPLVMQLMTDDPDVVLYWLAD